MTFGQDQRAMRRNFLVDMQRNFLVDMRRNFLVDMLAPEANAYRKLFPAYVKHYLRRITGNDIK